MVITKSVKLDAREQVCIEQALGIIDKIADACGNKSMDEVFNYFVEESEIIDKYKYSSPNIINIDDI